MPAVLLLALTRTETAARLGVGAGVALILWLVLLGVLAVISRARRPDPAPASIELGGDEPPAVVSMLANGWEVGREAVPATLLDLAARKIVSIDAAGPDHYVVRVPAKGSAKVAGNLLPYEEQVLDHVRQLAGPDGTVPGEALTTGPEAESARWWKSFASAVNKDARARGLSRGRWSGWMTALLSMTAFAPAVLTALAVVVLPNNRSSDSDNPIGAFIGLVIIVWGVLVAIPGKMRAERDTGRGREVAARWLGLRVYLHQDQAFAEAPPAAVAVWDRYLAYGAALGVAAAAVRALPLGAESDRVAWSAYGGRWRMVRIHYPKRVPPGWGRHPAAATAIALGTLVVAGAMGRLLFPALGDVVSRLGDEIRDHGLDGLALLGIGLLVVPALVIAFWLARSLFMLAVAVPDLFTRRVVEGVALRVHVRQQPYLAVDDGTRRELRAWLVDSALLGSSGVARGSVVRATVSPRLGHVFRLEKSQGGNPGP